MTSRFLLSCPKIGLDELKNPGWVIKCLFAEFIGTFILVLIGCGSCLGGEKAEIVRISIAFGISVASAAQAFGHISGCHINPAVTIGLFFGRKIGLLKGLLYIAAQLLGGLSGAFILYLISNKSVRGASRIGMTAIDANLSPFQGFAVEFFITFILVLVVFGAAGDENNDVKGSPPLAIGLSITACHLLAIPLTGSSMNPARTFGPAVILNDWTNHWVYWAGPCLGGILASYTYMLLFTAPTKRPLGDQYGIVRTQ
uniref:Aquaporin AQPAe.a n=1 Tax=Caligus rogercresseyi TaxID=217165 RepID=C1BNY4_CALRO|nr:Aquaporin AQPAe.a [Caligus rogercresseyi]